MSVREGGLVVSVKTVSRFPVNIKKNNVNYSLIKLSFATKNEGVIVVSRQAIYQISLRVQVTC